MNSFSLLFILYSLGGSRYKQPMLKKWKVILHLLESGVPNINYLKFFCMGDLFILSIHLFNHLFISIETHGYLFFTLGYNPVLLIYFVQIVLALAIGSP